MINSVASSPETFEGEGPVSTTTATTTDGPGSTTFDHFDGADMGHMTTPKTTDGGAMNDKYINDMIRAKSMSSTIQHNYDPYNNNNNQSNNGGRNTEMILIATPPLPSNVSQCEEE
eukprot:157706_1